MVPPRGHLFHFDREWIELYFPRESPLEQPTRPRLCQQPTNNRFDFLFDHESYGMELPYDHVHVVSRFHQSAFVRESHPVGPAS